MHERPIHILVLKETLEVKRRFSVGFKRWVWLLPPLLWMALMALFSTDHFSGSQTSRFIAPFLNWLFPNTDGAILDHIHFAIRKSGHLMEYAVLAWLWFFGLTRWSKEIPWRMQKIAIVSGLICLIFAITDEVHQSMTLFRSGQPTDVALDVLGASIMLGYLLKKTDPPAA